MTYIHIRNLEKYHAGYRDRELKWAKVYFGLVSGDPDFEMIESEVDKWRFVAMICLELRARKPIPNHERYWIKNGFDLKKRPIEETLNVLKSFLEITETQEEIPLSPAGKTEPPQTDRTHQFEVIWNDYPGKTGRKQALRHFLASVKSDEDFAKIQKALQNYLKSERVQKGFVQGGSRWFNDWQAWLEPNGVLIGKSPNTVVIPSKEVGFQSFLKENGKQYKIDYDSHTDQVKHETTYRALTSFNITELYSQYKRKVHV